MKDVSAIDAAKTLGISIDDLKILEKQGLLHAQHTKEGKRLYSSQDVSQIRSRRSFTVEDEASIVGAEIQRNTVSSISTFRKILITTGGLIAGYFVLVAVFAALFIVYPLQTSNFFGYYYRFNVEGKPQARLLMTQGKSVLAASTGSKSAATQTSVLADLLHPAAAASLVAVKAIDDQKYVQVITNPAQTVGFGDFGPPPVINGADGAPGPAGPQGIAGASGPQGLQGPTATNGVNGTNGTNGTSVADVMTTAGDIIIRDSGNVTTRLGAGTNGQVLGITGGVPAWENSTGGTSFSALTSGTNTTALMLVGTGASLSPTGSGTITANAFSGILPVGNGGTGASTFTTNGVLFGNGTGAIQTTSGSSIAQILLGDAGGIPTFTTLSGDATIDSTGVLTLKNTGTPGTYGTALNIPVLTTDAQGRVTTVVNTAIAGLTNANLSGTAGITNANLANSSVSLAGDSGSGSVSLGGTLTLTGAGITTIAASGSTFTLTSSEADTLASVTGRGATTSTSISTTGGATITSNGTLIASNGLTLTTGALNLTGTSGALTLSGLSASSISTGANGLTFTSSNFNTTATGINGTAIGTTTKETGAFTTLTSTGATDLANAGASNVTIATTGTGNVTIGNATGTFALTSNGGLNVTTGGALTGVASIDTIGTSATGLTFAGAGTISSTTTNAITVDSGTTGNVNLGTGASAKTVTIGNSTGATAVNINSGSGNVNFTVDGTGSSGKVQIGNSGTATPDLLVLDNGTADPTGVAGGMYYNTTTTKFRCFQNGAWANCIGGDRLFIPKSTDQSITSSTTLTDETTMQFSIAAGESWVFKYDLFVTNANSAAPDWKSAIVGPASSTCSVQLSGVESIGGNFPQAVSTDCTTPTAMVNSAVAADASKGYNAWMQGIITAGATPGTVKMQFAQNTSNAAAVTVKAGSFVSAYKVGGADLAEAYSSKDATIMPGDVVSLDSTLDNGVQKAKKQYDPTVLGIVSTKPGMVLGDSTVSGFPVLVALSGRVPVKVTTENGVITAGDYLTTSSIPGVAMRSTKAGAIIGTAMTDFNGTGIGKVVAFVKNGSSVGSNSEGIDGLMQLLTGSPHTVNDAFYISQELKDTSGSAQIEPDKTDKSVIETNLVGYITHVVSDMLKNTVEFLGTVIFHGDIKFLGRPSFNKDTAGHALIKAHESEVHIDFEKEYLDAPVVTANVSLVDGIKIDDVPSYAVYNITTKGFMIKLAKPAAFDLNFSWIALFGDTKSVSESTSQNIPPISAAPTVSTELSPTPAETVTASPSAEPTP